MNQKTSIPVTLRQLDQLLLWLAMALLIACAWLYLFNMAQQMSPMANTNMTAMMAQTAIQSWSMAEFWMMYLMWAIMMIAMMVPSAARTVMIYAQVAKKAHGNIVMSSYCFMLGYLIIWSLFSVIATLAQWLLTEASLLSPMMVATSPLLGAALLITAGLYQLTAFKDVCLQHCQSPIGFISQHFKQGNLGALTMGLHHGAYCLGCCWALMGLLFFAGVMNLLWILLITLFVLLEKLLPTTKAMTKASGILLLTLGLGYLLLPPVFS